jgi:hypothetical protein
MVAKKPKGKPRGKGKPFQPGFDPRRHLDGPPRKFDELRAMVLRLFEEEISVDVGEQTVKQTQAEFMLRTWILSQDGFKQNKALEIGFGKVPDEINVNTFDVSRFIQENIELFTDGQLQRLRAGESGESILAEVIREVMQAKTKKK